MPSCVTGELNPLRPCIRGNPIPYGRFLTSSMRLETGASEKSVFLSRRPRTLPACTHVCSRSTFRRWSGSTLLRSGRGAIRCCFAFTRGHLWPGDSLRATLSRAWRCVVLRRLVNYKHAYTWMQVLLQIFLRAKESPLIAGCFLTGGLPSGYVRTDDHPDYLDIFRYLGQRVLRIEWLQVKAARLPHEHLESRLVVGV